MSVYVRSLESGGTMLVLSGGTLLVLPSVRTAVTGSVKTRGVMSIGIGRKGRESVLN